MISPKRDEALIKESMWDAEYQAIGIESLEDDRHQTGYWNLDASQTKKDKISVVVPQSFQDSVLVQNSLANPDER